MIFVGNDDFKKVGLEYRKYLIDFCGLRPDSKVLDIGSGIGRMAVPLTDYLNSQGSYDGIDIVESGVTWCQQKIHPRFANFNFHLIDVYNKTYNPGGTQKSSEYRFPFPDKSFDVIFLTSVFTHMFPDDVKNYIREIGRVLRPEGRCLITFFLLNEESMGLIGLGKDTFKFKFSGEGYRTSNLSCPEDAIGLDEKMVRDFFRSAGLAIQEPVRYGGWAGRTNFLTFQDIVVATKEAVAGENTGAANIPARTA